MMIRSQERRSWEANQIRAVNSCEVDRSNMKYNIQQKIKIMSSFVAEEDFK